MRELRKAEGPSNEVVIMTRYGERVLCTDGQNTVVLIEDTIIQTYIHIGDFICTGRLSHHHWSLVVGRLLSVEVGGLSRFLDHELSNDNQRDRYSREDLMMSAMKRKRSDETYRSSK
jgi:hypothetical protein